MVYPALLPLMRTPRLTVVDWTDAPADLNGLVLFAERRNLVYARVTSHFNWPLRNRPSTVAENLRADLFKSVLILSVVNSQTDTRPWVRVVRFSHRRRCSISVLLGYDTSSLGIPILTYRGNLGVSRVSRGLGPVDPWRRLTQAQCYIATTDFSSLYC
jgi:hypothetical protein